MLKDNTYRDIDAEESGILDISLPRIMDISEEANQVSETPNDSEDDSGAQVAAESPSNGNIDYYGVVYMNNEEFSNIKTVN